IVRFEPTSLLFAPSIRNRLFVVGLPLTEKSTPPRSPLLLVLNWLVRETPGCNCVSSTKFPPFRGSWVACSAVTISPTAAEVVCTPMAVASTVTDSPELPTDRVACSSVTLETLTITLRVTFCLKPCASMVTVYVPGGRLAALYSPEAEVVKLWDRPVDGFVTVTFALGTTAPEGSLTVPRIVPDVTVPCPCARTQSREPVRRTRVRIFSVAIASPVKVSCCGDS